MSKTNTIVEGPKGYKMPETLARAIEDAAKSAGVKADEYRRLSATPADFRLEDGSRTDVSTITTDAVDRDREVVLPKGLNLDQFRANPVVPFAHKYDELPVGRALWVKPSDKGLVAATKYASKPKDWGGGWLPDAIVSMMQEGICTGKSIGFLPTEIRSPTKAEIDARPELKNCRAVISAATMLEYSVAPVPANQEAIAIAVSKCAGDAKLKSLFEAVAKDGGDMGGEMTEAMPACPKCQETGPVSRNSAGISLMAYQCAACAIEFDGDDDKPLATTPKAITPFVTEKTIIAYAEHEACKQFGTLRREVADRLIDRIYELMGRA